MRHPVTVTVALALTLPLVPSLGQTPARGDMDALLGPATVVNQGLGMSDEIRRALAPGREHEVLARLAGDWRVEGIAGPNHEPVTETAQVTPLLGGAWFELRLFSDGEVTRLAHLGFDGYRGSYAMWEVGRGFTSPQARAGESRADGAELHFWRTYTIRRRGEPTAVRERLVITFLDGGGVRWQSFETVGSSAERTQRDVTFTRAR